MARSRANKIPALIAQLTDRRRSVVDTARARLSIIGARAVRDLIGALEGQDDKLRARVMPLLALIQDARGREPLIAMLLDHDSRLRRIAARSLARFPSNDTVMALLRLIDREKSPATRAVAVQSLVAQYAAGRESALGPLLTILLDTDRHARIRIAALDVLPHLKSNQRRGILDKLADDPDETVRERAASSQPDGSGVQGDISSRLTQLGETDYSVWNQAIHRLSRLGIAAVTPLIDEMERRAHDPEYCTRAGMVLKAMGPRRGRVIADALNPDMAALPLQVLVEVLGAFGEKALIYRLKDLIDELAAARSSGSNRCEGLQRVRAKAHLELARIGSRVAIADLRDGVTRRGERVELEMIAALGMIGKRDELPLLLRIWGREDPFVRRRIAEAVRLIMRRERIRPGARFEGGLEPPEKAALDAIFSKGNGRKRRASRPRPS